DVSIEWFDKALEVNRKDGNAMRDKGVSLSEKGDEDGAIVWFDKALEVNRKDWNAMRDKGVSLSKKGDEDGAIVWFDKALEVNPKDGAAMRQKGVSLSEKGDEDGAIVWFDKGLGVNPKDSAAHRNRGVFEINRGNKHGAFEWMCSAVKLDRDRGQAEFRAVCKMCDKFPDVEWGKLFGPTARMKVSAEESLKELPLFIGTIREAFRDEAEGYLEKIKKWKADRSAFLQPESLLDPGASVFMVLRKWNSYTPALPSAEDERSRGGGYFLWHNGRGTVIDPGYNFIENFHEARCRICDIDNVILTHAHNDHTNDFESLRVLLHQYNDELPAAEKKKRVRFFLNNGAFRKFAGMVDLKDDDFTDRVFTLNAGGEFELLGGGGRFRVLAAYHDEVLARDQAVGLGFRIPIGQEERKVLVTSDTGLFPLKREGKPVPDTSERGAEVWRDYLKDGWGKEPDLMVVHIGSIREEELRRSGELDPAKACYANHLGIIGTARVIAMCRPRVAVISEFGEEMKDFRTKLVEGLQTKVLDVFYRGNETPHVPRVVPGDLGFIYDLRGRRFWDCVGEEWSDGGQIDFGDGDSGDPSGVYYFAKDRRATYGQEPKQYAGQFRSDREYRKGMYFLAAAK
ncbi:MAG: MBL fold metallo-hydrolase, partial [Planctomycetota bacterium]|nr:MBL fold metallo-hydrolase [Planctomycetota bacterium]